MSMFRSKMQESDGPSIESINSINENFSLNPMTDYHSGSDDDNKNPTRDHSKLSQSTLKRGVKNNHKDGDRQPNCKRSTTTTDSGENNTSAMINNDNLNQDESDDGYLLAPSEIIQLLSTRWTCQQRQLCIAQYFDLEKTKQPPPKKRERRPRRKSKKLEIPIGGFNDMVDRERNGSGIEMSELSEVPGKSEMCQPKINNENKANATDCVNKNSHVTWNTDVVYNDESDTKFPPGINPLAFVLKSVYACAPIEYQTVDSSNLSSKTLTSCRFVIDFQDGSFIVLSDGRCQEFLDDDSVIFDNDTQNNEHGMVGSSQRYQLLPTSPIAASMELAYCAVRKRMPPLADAQGEISLTSFVDCLMISPIAKIIMGDWAPRSRTQALWIVASRFNFAQFGLTIYNSDKKRKHGYNHIMIVKQKFTRGKRNVKRIPPAITATAVAQSMLRTRPVQVPVTMAPWDEPNDVNDLFLEVEGKSKPPTSHNWSRSDEFNRLEMFVSINNLIPTPIIDLLKMLVDDNMGCSVDLYKCLNLRSNRRAWLPLPSVVPSLTGLDTTKSTVVTTSTATQTDNKSNNDVDKMTNNTIDAGSNNMDCVNSNSSVITETSTSPTKLAMSYWMSSSSISSSTRLDNYFSQYIPNTLVPFIKQSDRGLVTALFLLKVDTTLVRKAIEDAIESACSIGDPNVNKSIVIRSILMQMIGNVVSSSDNMTTLNQSNPPMPSHSTIDCSYPNNDGRNLHSKKRKVDHEHPYHHKGSEKGSEYDHNSHECKIVSNYTDVHYHNKQDNNNPNYSHHHYEQDVHRARGSGGYYKTNQRHVKNSNVLPPPPPPPPKHYNIHGPTRSHIKYQHHSSRDNRDYRDLRNLRDQLDDNNGNYIRSRKNEYRPESPDYTARNRDMSTNTTATNQIAETLDDMSHHGETISTLLAMVPEESKPTLSFSPASPTYSPSSPTYRPSSPSYQKSSSI